MNKKIFLKSIKYFCILCLYEFIFIFFVKDKYNINCYLFLIIAILISYLLALFDNIFKKHFLIFSIIIFFLISLYYSTEVILYKTFGNCMPLFDIFKNTGNVYNSFLDFAFESIIKNYYIIIFFILPIIILLIFNNDKTSVSFDNKNVIFIIVDLILIFIVVLFFADKNINYENRINKNGLFVTTINDLLPDIDINKNVFLFIGSDYNENQNLSTENNVNFTILNDKNELKLNFDNLEEHVKSQNIHNINEYVKNQTASSKNKWTGIFKGKSIILICAEAFSHNVIDKELTPTLYRMKYNGFNFTNYYQPSWGGSTSTGEYSFLFGLVPYDYTQSISKTIDNENNFTLPHILRDMGYKSYAFHNGSYTYYDRHLTHRNIGFDDFISIGNKLEGFTEDINPEDDDMIKNTLDTFATQDPFCLYYMTISGHASYNKPYDKKVAKNLNRVRDRYGDTLPELLENYLCYQLCLEDAMSSAIDILSKKGLIDDVVFCITADHYPHGLDGKYIDKNTGEEKSIFSKFYNEEKVNKYLLDKNELLIWSSSMENDLKEYKTTIEDVTYSLDILPTLLNLFGIDFDSRLYVGRDVFSEKPPLVVYNNRSFITNNGIYDTTRDRFIPNDPDEVLIDEWLQYIKNIVNGKVEYSYLVVKYDYFKYLKYLFE